MPRPLKRRRCRSYDGDDVFKPRSIPMSDLETTRLELSELEVMRHCDLEGRDQEEAGKRMAVSRGTVQRLLKSGRAKVIRSLLDSRALLIAQGADHEDLYTDERKTDGAGRETNRDLRKGRRRKKHRQRLARQGTA